jgi:hypothetical protein
MQCNRVSFKAIETISDVWFNLEQFFLIPGNILFSIIDTVPKLQYFFEINCFNYGLLIGVISFFLWIIALSLLNIRN